MTRPDRRGQAGRVILAGLCLTILAIDRGTAADAPAPAKPPAAPAASPPTPAATPAAAPSGAAHGSLGASLLGDHTKGPVDITSNDGIEWRQSERVYIARGNAVAKRGDATLYADTITAYYRDIPNSSQTEIWRIVADGHVKGTTPTQTVVGDHGVYDLDRALVVLTGEHLQLTTPKDTVVARDSLEWYDDKQLAVARGNAAERRADRLLRGDTLAAQVVNVQGQGAHITRIDAKGHVVVSGKDQVGTGDKGVYNAETGIATLAGNVRLTRGPNVMAGDNAVMDLNSGVSRLLPRAPADGDASVGRVQGYLVPRPKNEAEPAKPR